MNERGKAMAWIAVAVVLVLCAAVAGAWCIRSCSSRRMIVDNGVRHPMTEREILVADAKPGLYPDEPWLGGSYVTLYGRDGLRGIEAESVTYLMLPNGRRWSADDLGAVECYGDTCPAEATSEAARADLAGYGVTSPEKFYPECKLNPDGTGCLSGDLVIGWGVSSGPYFDDHNPDSERRRQWDMDCQFRDHDNRARRRAWLLMGGPEPVPMPMPERPLTQAEILERSEAAMRKLEAMAEGKAAP